MKRVKNDLIKKKPLIFNLEKKYKRARKSLMTLPHGNVSLPIYMPVGTKGKEKKIICPNFIFNDFNLKNLKI